MANTKKKNNLIVENRKASFEYHLEEHFEAGISLLGWEVKSIRNRSMSGGINITEAYVFIRNGEAFISGLRIEPLISVSTHEPVEPTRVRKLLLNKKEIKNMAASVDRDGMTLVAKSMYWSETGKVKLDICLAKGKKLHDKRQSEKAKDWERDKQRIQKAVKAN